MNSSVERSTFPLELMKWYLYEGYSFPWRNTSDPYFIWLSEVMLQQTRVSTASPYYQHWISSLPDIRSVAESPLDNILKLWEGLGYYGRARNFHKACKIVIEKHGGVIPSDPLEFSKLPGVGPYICAAVMSIAFNLPIPAADGNAIRVISRLNSINTPYPKSKKRIVTFLSEHIDTIMPGYFNQAIMDLGREICTSKNPSCYICPVNKYCCSYVNDTVDKYPAKIKKVSRPHYRVAVGLIWKNNRILISKRRESGLLGGLWEFPGGKIRPSENGSSCIVREARETLNVLVDPLALVKQIKHAYSHFSITVDAYSCMFRGGRPRALGCADFRWIHPSETRKFAFHRANHKLFDKILGTASV